MAVVPEALQARIHRIEELVLRIDRIPDPESRRYARELMESILELHGAGLGRMMEITVAEGDPGAVLIRRFSQDDLVAALLLLHNLHPDDLPTRVRHAIRNWHGSVELLGEFEGVIRLRLSEGARGIKEAVEAAVREAAPDAVEIAFEESHRPADFIPLSALELVKTPIGVSGAD